MGFALAIADVDGISMLVGEVEHLPNGDILPIYVVNESLALHACHEGVNDVGNGDILESILVLGEAPDVVTQALLCLTLAS